MENYERLEVIKDCLLRTQKMCVWHLNDDMELLSTNCPDRDFFYELFLLGSCKEAIRALSAPGAILMSDQMAFGWLALRPEAKEVYLMGPFFTVEATENYIISLCYKHHYPEAMLQKLLFLLKKIPAIPASSVKRLGSMLWYGLCGAVLEDSKIGTYSASTESTGIPAKDSWLGTHWHGTWQAEAKLFRDMSEGKAPSGENLSRVFASGNVGKIANNNALRQAKNETLVLIVLCSRAAMVGGVSPEGAYNMADYYFQLTEACSTLQEVSEVCSEAYDRINDRIRKVKQTTEDSAMVNHCREYIATHILEKINLTEMAQSMGYSNYYLSRKFKEETGQSISQYITYEKIELAKEILKHPAVKLHDVSEHLSFSSPSYFSSVFRKQVGKTPEEYRDSQG